MGAIPGVLGALGGAIATWVKRARYDELALSNRSYVRSLEREVRLFDARAGQDASDPSLSASDDEHRRFERFVLRCEDISESIDPVTNDAIANRRK